MTHRTPPGFTLIELLIVVVIIGLLATIAIPKFSATRDRALVAAMKSDLRNLVTAEESYFGDYVTYTSALGTAFNVSRGVTVTFGTVTGSGWAASAAHVGTTKTCSIYVGRGPGVVISGQNEAEPKCQ
jgi:prepilin-type N-terminal cleavage/methylation domain-containing protein